MRWPALLLIATLVVAGCGTSHGKTATQTRVTVTTATPPPATTTTTTTSTGEVPTVAAPTTLRVYFLRDGEVAPVARTIPTTPAVATAALAALTKGPSAAERRLGLTTAVPIGGDAPPLLVARGVAIVRLPPNATRPELAQIVYTLTQFPTVHAVRSPRMVGDAPPLTRQTGQAATSPLEVRGTANTFEATFQLELRNSSGVPVASRFVTATSGSGERGTFDATISFPHTGGPLTLVAYEQSAENGKPIHVVRIPLQEG